MAFPVALSARRVGMRAFVCCALVLSLLAASAAAIEDLTIVRADRQIDLQTHLIREATSLKIENSGNQPVSTITFAVPVNPPARLAFASAVVLQGKAKSRTFHQLTLDAVTPDSSAAAGLPAALAAAGNVSLFTATLPKPLEAGKTLLLESYFVLLGGLTPHPAQITQADPQLVVFRGSHLLLAPYPVRTQSTAVKLPSQQVESFTPREPSRKADSEVRYGPYEETGAWEVSPLAVHYENNRPFPVFARVEREIEVSHWGNVYVTEDYFLTHGGAKHKGMFSRLDFHSRPMAVGVSSIRALMAVLPATAHSVYYRDEIGNISTSHLRYAPSKAELEIEPRYPLLGGWSVEFRVGYSAPLEAFVAVGTDGTRVLNASIGCAFMDVPADELTVKVVLPEGSYAIASDVPVAVDKSFETKYSYLDTVGRPVVVLKRSDVAPEVGTMHFQVRYRFSSVALLTEPLLLVAAFFLLFLLLVAYVRADLTIARTAPAYLARLHHEELLEYLQRLQRLVAERGAAVDELDASLVRLGRTADVAAAKSARKAAEVELKESLKDVATVVAKLETMPKAPAQLRTALALVALDRERADKALAKHAAAVEAFERKASSKEMDAKLAPLQQRLAAIRAEIKGLLVALEE